MSECCNYFLVEIKSGSKWVNIGIQSKEMTEIISALENWFSENGKKEYRIVQRSIEQDRALGKRVPRCC